MAELVDLLQPGASVGFPHSSDKTLQGNAECPQGKSIGGRIFWSLLWKGTEIELVLVLGCSPRKKWWLYMELFYFAIFGADGDEKAEGRSVILGSN